ncbi:MAG TPA: TetR/AcrR family transcriptional regulator [Treponemataceae bacterium]|jgi:AcrR family transcriptional regulator|nr:TetR/AcrR family transcriptional regulator [Treponemataceae bacterium]
MNTRSEQKEKRRQEILNIGLDLFIRKGFAATKISDIAERANMSIGLLFHYFKSKEELYEELIQIGISGSKAILPDADTDPIAFFEATAKKVLDYAVNDPFTAKMFVLINQAEHGDGANESIMKHLQQDEETLASFAALIEEGQRNGTIRAGNAMALVVAFWAAIQGICEMIALNPDTPCPQSEWIVDILRRKES